MHMYKLSYQYCTTHVIVTVIVCDHVSVSSYSASLLFPESLLLINSVICVLWL